MVAVEVIEVLGASEESFDAAVQEAVERACETVDDVHGVEVEGWTATVTDGEITEYRATVEFAFPVHERE